MSAVAGIKVLQKLGRITLKAKRSFSFNELKKGERLMTRAERAAAIKQGSSKIYLTKTETGEFRAVPKDILEQRDKMRNVVNPESLRRGSRKRRKSFDYNKYMDEVDLLETPYNKLTKDQIKSLRNSGLVGADIALGALTIGAPLGVAAFKAAKEPFTDTRFDKEIAQARSDQKVAMMNQSRAIRLNKLKQDNLRRLAAADPMLVRKLLAGMDMSEGSTMIGGEPRMDILDNVLGKMAQGQIGEDIDPFLGAMA